MSRATLAGLALLLLAAGLLWLPTRSQGPACSSVATEIDTGRPRLVGTPGAQPAALGAPALDGPRSPGAPQDATAPVRPTSEDGAGDAAAPTVHPLTPREVERLVRSVGERGELALADDPTTREVYQHLQAAGAWTLGGLPEALRATDSALRLGAAALLGVHGDADAGRALADQLDREREPAVRRILVEALAGLESPAAADALLRVWEDPHASEALRRYALQGLGSLGHSAARVALRDPLTSAPLRRLAEIGLVRALRTRGATDSTLRSLVESIASSSPHEASRLEAAEALAASPR